MGQRATRALLEPRVRLVQQALREPQVLRVTPEPLVL